MHINKAYIKNILEVKGSYTTLTPAQKKVIHDLNLIAKQLHALLYPTNKVFFRGPQKRKNLYAFHTATSYTFMEKNNNKQLLHPNGDQNAFKPLTTIEVGSLLAARSMGAANCDGIAHIANLAVINLLDFLPFKKVRTTILTDTSEQIMHSYLKVDFYGDDDNLIYSCIVDPWIVENQNNSYKNFKGVVTTEKFTFYSKNIDPKKLDIEQVNTVHIDNEGNKIGTLESVKLDVNAGKQTVLLSDKNTYTTQRNFFCEIYNSLEKETADFIEAKLEEPSFNEQGWRIYNNSSLMKNDEENSVFGDDNDLVAPSSQDITYLEQIILEAQQISNKEYTHNTPDFRYVYDTQGNLVIDLDSLEPSRSVPNTDSGLVFNSDLNLNNVVIQNTEVNSKKEKGIIMVDDKASQRIITSNFNLVDQYFCTKLKQIIEEFSSDNFYEENLRLKFNDCLDNFQKEYAEKRDRANNPSLDEIQTLKNLSVRMNLGPNMEDNVRDLKSSFRYLLINLRDFLKLKSDSARNNFFERTKKIMKHYFKDFSYEINQSPSPLTIVTLKPNPSPVLINSKPSTSEIIKKRSLSWLKYHSQDKYLLKDHEQISKQYGKEMILIINDGLTTNTATAKKINIVDQFFCRELKRLVDKSNDRFLDEKLIEEQFSTVLIMIQQNCRNKIEQILSNKTFQEKEVAGLKALAGLFKLDPNNTKDIDDLRRSLSYICTHIFNFINLNQAGIKNLYQRAKEEIENYFIDAPLNTQTELNSQSLIPEKLSNILSQGKELSLQNPTQLPNLDSNDAAALRSPPIYSFGLFKNPSTEVSGNFQSNVASLEAENLGQAQNMELIKAIVSKYSKDKIGKKTTQKKPQNNLNSVPDHSENLFIQYLCHILRTEVIKESLLQGKRIGDLLDDAEADIRFKESFLKRVKDIQAHCTAKGPDFKASYTKTNPINKLAHLMDLSPTSRILDELKDSLKVFGATKRQSNFFASTEDKFYQTIYCLVKSEVKKGFFEPNQNANNLVDSKKIKM